MLKNVVLYNDLYLQKEKYHFHYYCMTKYIGHSKFNAWMIFLELQFKFCWSIFVSKKHVSLYTYLLVYKTVMVRISINCKNLHTISAFYVCSLQKGGQMYTSLTVFYMETLENTSWFLFTYLFK